MSNFFEKSDLSRNNAENIISDTLKKCDDGELYLENSKSENILLDDNRIKNSSYSSDLGFGFRAVSDEIVAYSHSNEISKNSLKQSSENLKSTLKSAKGTYNHSINKSNKNDVIQVFGQPATKGMVDENLWIYIERTITRGKILKLCILTSSWTCTVYRPSTKI